MSQRRESGRKGRRDQDSNCAPNRIRQRSWQLLECRRDQLLCREGREPSPTPSYSKDKGVAENPRRGHPEVEMGSHHIHQLLRLVERRLHQLSSSVGTCPALARHPSNTGAFGTDVIERETDSHEDAKQTESEQSQPCVAQALMGIDRRVEDVERHERVVGFKACPA